jgi:hypothetical protein
VPTAAITSSAHKQKLCHPERSIRIRCARIWAQQTIQTRVEGPAVPAGAATTPEESKKPVIPKELSSRPERSGAEGPAFAGAATTPEESEKPVILSEASEYVAPAFGRNKQFRRESNGPAVPAGATTTPVESEKPVILSEASKYVAPAFGRNQQFRRESNGPAVPAGTTTTPAESEKPVILSEASEYVAPAFGRNKQFRREPKDLLLALPG